MAERHQTIVTEPALADALDQLVGLIEELCVEITNDETDLVKLTFSGTPDVGFAMGRAIRDVPGEVIRRIWNEGRRDYDIIHRHHDAR